MVKAIIISLAIIIFTIYYMIKHMHNNIVKNMIPKVRNKNTHNNDKQNALKNVNDKFLDEEFLRVYHDMQYDFIEEAKYFNNHCCPYCGTVFEKEIKTTKNCFSCKNKIIKRSNYLTKQGYLLAVDRINDFEKLQKRLSNIRFYEDKFRYISMSEPDIKTMVKVFRKKPAIHNEKDLFWNICNSLSSECIFEGTKLLKKILNSNNDINLINKACSYFLKDTMFQRLKIETIEYEKKYNLLDSFMPQYIYCEIISHYINVKFDKLNIWNMDLLYRGINIKPLKDYLENYNISLNKFKNNFMLYAHGYPISLISKEEAWKIIEISLKIQSS